MFDRDCLPLTWPVQALLVIFESPCPRGGRRSHLGDGVKSRRLPRVWGVTFQVQIGPETGPSQSQIRASRPPNFKTNFQSSTLCISRNHASQIQGRPSQGYKQALLEAFVLRLFVERKEEDWSETCASAAQAEAKHCNGQEEKAAAYAIHREGVEGATAEWY